MPEQESNPELQAAQEDAFKKFKEAYKAEFAGRLRYGYSHGGEQAIREAGEKNRTFDECKKLEIPDDKLSGLIRDIEAEVRAEYKTEK